MKALYRLRYWEPDEIRTLSDREIQDAITHFYAPEDRETRQTVQDLSRLITEQLRRHARDRGRGEDER